jgi:hypothetical protein
MKSEGSMVVMELLFELYGKYTSPLIANNERREKKLKKAEQ